MPLPVASRPLLRCAKKGKPPIGLPPDLKAKVLKGITGSAANAKLREQQIPPGSPLETLAKAVDASQDQTLHIGDFKLYYGLHAGGQQSAKDTLPKLASNDPTLALLGEARKRAVNQQGSARTPEADHVIVTYRLDTHELPLVSLRFENGDFVRAILQYPATQLLSLFRKAPNNLPFLAEIRSAIGDFEHDERFKKPGRLVYDPTQRKWLAPTEPRKILRGSGIREALERDEIRSATPDEVKYLYALRFGPSVAFSLYSAMPTIAGLGLMYTDWQVDEFMTTLIERMHGQFKGTIHWKFRGRIVGGQSEHSEKLVQAVATSMGKAGVFLDEIDILGTAGRSIALDVATGELLNVA